MGMARSRVGAAAQEMAFTPVRHRESGVVVFFRTLGRLLLPVALLLAVMAGAFVATGFPITQLDPYVPEFPPSQWLTWGHVGMAASFFAVSLANRRYGLGIATGQILVSWAIMGAVVAASKFYPFPKIEMVPEISWAMLPPFRILSAFVGALLLAQLLSALVFDRTRGILWWQAPLYAGLWGAIIFVGAFYPAAYYGTSEPYLNRMMIHLGLLAAAAFVLVIPYWIMRPMVRPLPGFGGY